MAGDAIPLEYVCARWAYSELLSVNRIMVQSLSR